METRTNDAKELLAQMRVAILSELEFCNIGETPHVCNLVSTEKGKEGVIDMVLEIVGRRGFSIEEAINEVERQYDVTRAED